MATFTDPGGAEPNAFDPGPLSVDYSASINWGDGSTTPGTITYSGAVGFPTGVFSVASPHTYGEEGVFTITTVISHEASTPQTVISTATVSDPNVIATGGFAFTAVEGAAAASQTVATFTDPGGAEPNAFDPGPLSVDYSATIDWGDGSTTPGTITYSGAVGSPTGVFSVASPHTYGEEGALHYHHRHQPRSLNPQTVISTATVSDPNVIATGGFTFTAVEGAAAASQTVATFTDPGGAEPNAFDPGPLSVDYMPASTGATAAPRPAPSPTVGPWDSYGRSALPAPTPMVKRASSPLPPSSATKPQRRRRSSAPPRSATRT